MGKYCSQERCSGGICTAVILWLLLLFPVLCKAESGEIEQVYIQKPDVIVYYRTGEEQGSPSAWLGGEKLSLAEDQVFSETDEAVVYYVLIDISASIPSARFEDIRNSLKDFYQNLREKDRLILVTFGDAVTTVLSEEEDADAALEKIAALQNQDQNTLLFEAVESTADKITAEADKSRKRRIMVVISDGKDCADNTRTMESVEKRLISNGIPVYTLAVENNEGDSASQMQEYRSKFSTMASDTGGIPWTIDQGSTVMDGMKTVSEAVLNSRRGTFRSASNIVSNQNEDFVLKLPDGGARTVSILVSRSQADTTAPEVEKITVGEANELIIRYSEPVDHALDTGNYRVRNQNKTIAVQQVLLSQEDKNTVRLIFSQDLTNGEYGLEISHVTDVSNEANPLGNAVNSFTIAGMKEPETTPETTTSDEPETIRQDEEEKNLFPMRTLWSVLGTLLFLLVLLGFLIGRKIRRQNSGEEPKDIPLDGKHSIPRVFLNPVSGTKARTLNFRVHYGDGEPEYFTSQLQGSVIVGRNSEACGICCNDPTMGRQHFAISEEEDGLYVTDLNSLNGTFVNGVRVRDRMLLHEGDEIQAGSMYFRINWNEENEAVSYD